MGYFKKIPRKGGSLDLDHLPKRRIASVGIIGFLDRLLFQKPVSSLSFLIVCVALPVTLYLTVREETTIPISEAESTRLRLTASNVENIAVDKEYVNTFQIVSKGLEDLEFIEIKSPSWFRKGESIEQSSSDGSILYESIAYAGTTGSTARDRFAILAKGEKLSLISECSGCDEDVGNLYSLLEFNLDPSDCDKKSVWGRNPVGRMDSSEAFSFCREFENECLVSSTWKKFSSSEECKNSLNAPQFKEVEEDRLFTFWSTCDGFYEEEIFQFNSIFKAQDLDGDIVRFTCMSPGDFISVSQDSIEEIVSKVSAVEGLNYPDYSYSALISGEITTDHIGKTYPVQIRACDVLGKCANKTLEVSVIERSSCGFILPETGLIDVGIAFPEEGDDLKGSEGIAWKMTGANQYDVEVKLYEEECGKSKNFISDLVRLEKLNLKNNKGYSFNWNSSEQEDGEYCILVLARDADKGSVNRNWSSSSQIAFNIENDNQDPSIVSVPDETDLVTGQEFEYKIEASDADSDTIQVKVFGLPEWLNFEEKRVFGSTVVPGNYSFVVYVNDNHGGSDRQLVNLNIYPPTNNTSDIEFVFPTKDSVLAGEENNLKWEVSDADGISLTRLYYSEDASNFELVSTYSSDTLEAAWDVSDFANGKYYLKLVVVDTSTQEVESGVISDGFYVTNSKVIEVPNDNNTSMPAINNLTPVSDSEIYSLRPLISASLYPSDEADIILSDIEILLNDENITPLCEVSETDVFCQSEESMDIGRHKIRINIEDSSGKEMSEEWYFTISEMLGGSDGDDSLYEERVILLPIINIEVKESVLIVILVLFLTVFLLVGVPWLIYYIWKRGKSRKGGGVKVSSETPQATPAFDFYTPSATSEISSDQRSKGVPISPVA